MSTLPPTGKEPASLSDRKEESALLFCRRSPYCRRRYWEVTRHGNVPCSLRYRAGRCAFSFPPCRAVECLLLTVRERRVPRREMLGVPLPPPAVQEGWIPLIRQTSQPVIRDHSAPQIPE